MLTQRLVLRSARLLSVLLAAGLLTSCFHAADDDALADGTTRLTLQVVSFEQVPFATPGGSRAVALADLATRLNFAVFDGTQKVSNISQSAGDSGFGAVSVNLAPGDYTVVVAAHSQTKSITVASPSEVQFSNPLTDVFYYSGDVSVGDRPSAQDISLSRAVAMFRFNCTDPVPEGVVTMQFKYSGGSLRLDPSTGFGTSASSQTATFDIDESHVGQPATFEVYTFPHQTDDVLTKMTVSALDAEENVLYERTFQNVPIKTNQITVYSGAFFTGTGSGGDASFSIEADGAWGAQRNFVF